jgi:tetratricopeptide (TPR) repeat protein
VLAHDQSALAEARGDLDEALAAAERAVSLVEASSQGLDVMPRVLQRRADARLAQGHAAAAVADAERAVALERDNAEPGARTSRLGRAYLTLGRVLLAAGRAAEARAALSEAAAHLESSLGADHVETSRATALLRTLPAS